MVAKQAQQVNLPYRAKWVLICGKEKEGVVYLLQQFTINGSYQRTPSLIYMDNSMREALIKTYNLQSLPVEEQDEMIQQIGGMIFQSVLLRVAPQLNETQQKELEMILDADGTPEQLLGYLNGAVPGFADIIKEEADAFKAQSEALMSQVDK
jgi:hypothetical protein